ncbi:uncharacterized protein LOC143065301 isoform X1 [Mytilus galloprovincialis]|uniref:uncharacterized protein LOC143065301 isoform X1 n=1 Tax=Mytilus galloprovincialis TaxID=29158 RepID=UPI003F7B74D3
MSSTKKVKSKQIIEVTVDQPKERPSTQIHLNEQFSIDLEDLTYKKTKESTNETTFDRQSKSKETNYLEEIDDGPKRLTTRSDYTSICSIDTLDLKPQDVAEQKTISANLGENVNLPTELIEEDHCAISAVSPGKSHTEHITEKKRTKDFTSESRARSLNRSTKVKTKGDDKRNKKNDSKAKTSKNKGKEDDRVNLECSILSRKEEPNETRRSVYRTNDAGNGIEIVLPSYLLPDDHYFESVVWNPEQRGLFLKENSFSHQNRFRTDIFHIYKRIPKDEQKTKGNPKSLYYPDIDSSNITVKVHIPELSQMNGLCLHFRAHVRSRKQWTIVDTQYHHQEGTVTFNCNQMDSFCIISTPREETHTVTPDGYEYVSEADSRIHVDFPLGAVSQDETVDFRVIPLNRESMACKIERNPRNCFILAISECLAVRHSVVSFNKPVDIQLPVDDLPGIDSQNVDCKYGVFKRKHKGSFWLTNLDVEERNGIPTISVNSFSEYVILKVRSDMFSKLQSLLPEEIEVAIGDKMCCKILIFVSNRKPSSISVILECCTKDSTEEVTQRRRQMGYELLRQCPSPDFFFPVNQRIRVDVGGRFALTKHIGKGYYFLTFFPIAADNFICFPVERYNGMESAVYGIISFKEDNGTKKDLHAIHYDPWSSRGRPQGKQLTMAGSRSAPVSRQMTAASDDVRKNKDDVNFDEIFFSDKGLLAVAQALSPDSMFKVVINLDMTKVQYEQITNDYSALTTSSRHLQLLKTALEISSNEPKIQRLTSSLRDSDETSIADKVEELYYEKMRLSRSNLERKATVVTIKSDRKESEKRQSDL